MVEREYAKALHDLAIEEAKLDCFLECFKALNESLSDKEFYNLLSSPIIDSIEKKKIIYKVYKSFDETFINFLCVIIDHNRFSIILNIYDEFKNLVMEDNNIIRIQILSANELKKSQIKQLENTLMDKYKGKQLEIENIVNSELIGGIQIISNDESIDITLKSTLNKMKESL